MIYQWHQSYGWQQWGTSRPYKQAYRQSKGIWNGDSTEKSKIITNSLTDISAGININTQRLEGDQFQVPRSNPVQGWHLLSRNLHQVCLSDGTNGKIKTGSGEAKPSALQAISSCTSLLSPPSSSMAVRHGPCLLSLRKNMCLWKLLHNPYLEHKTNVGVEQNQLPCVPAGTCSGKNQKPETCMVCAYHKL